MTVIINDSYGKLHHAVTVAFARAERCRTDTGVWVAHRRSRLVAARNPVMAESICLPAEKSISRLNLRVFRLKLLSNIE